MLSTILLAASSFVLSFLLTPLVRDLARRLGWVDQPDNSRKRHATPIPRIGGVPIVLAYAGSFFILLFMGLWGSSTIGQSLPLVWKLLPAAVLIFATGLLDDLIGLKPWQKLSAETVAAGFACFGGIQVQSLAGSSVHGFLSVPITIIWLVGCANAFNLVDGVDGLASGLGLVASLTMLVAGLLHGDAGLVIATAPLAGALLGFLLFNFSPASIFLGDCGSLWVGFMLGCYGAIWSQKSATVLGITAPVMALSIPLLDTALSIARRFLRQQPIFSGDRGHIHHRLLDRGLTPRRVVLLLYAASGLGAGLSLLQSTGHNGVKGPAVALFCAVVWVGIQYLSYQEFGAAVRLFRRNSLRSMVKSHVSLHACEESLRAAANGEECWQAIRAVGRELGFCNVVLCLGGRRYHEHLERPASRRWMLHIPVSDLDYVRFMCDFGLTIAPTLVAQLADLLHQTLSAKAVEFRTDVRLTPQKAAASGSRMRAEAYHIGKVRQL